ncbi:RHS repeat-associated core domain-containing protein [Shewanella algae]|uniref:RHS repeat-associated core domain-containing protein n=1 Tax=Shewanella algae TaxID=38313 RepID=UPI0034D76FD9
MIRNLLLVILFNILAVLNVNATVVYLHTDQLGSVISRTDATGNVIERNVYEPFGKRIGGEKPDIGYTGHLQDKDLGLTYMQARYYDPLIGRFYANDPVGWTPSNPVMSFNRYLYVNNNPYKYTDPSGQILESIWDVASLSIGITSLGSNLSKGNWGAAALDTLGVIADGTALALPGVPGGAGMAITASRQGVESVASNSNKLFHYTDEAGAKAIAETGVIKGDAQGRVYVTTDQISAADANNALFMGQGGTKGTHRVEITPADNLPLVGGTQPNELIHQGSIRDGRQGTIEVKENDF